MTDHDSVTYEFGIERAAWGGSGKYGAECSRPILDEDARRLGYGGSSGAVGLPSASRMLGYDLGAGSVVKVTVEVVSLEAPTPTGLWLRQEADAATRAARKVARDRGGSIKEGSA